jgi:hypothetical protein
MGNVQVFCKSARAVTQNCSWGAPSKKTSPVVNCWPIITFEQWRMVLQVTKSTQKVHNDEDPIQGNLCIHQQNHSLR